jgi:hypothetical protein
MLNQIEPRANSIAGIELDSILPLEPRRKSWMILVHEDRNQRPFPAI